MPFFADTNVCSKWESDLALKRNWEGAKADLESRGHQYVACPEVLIELLDRLVKPEPEYFSKDLRSFAFLNGPEEVEFLPFPGAFVLKAALGLDSPVARFNTAHFRQWLQCVLAAPTRDALSSGKVEMNGSMLVSYGIDLSKVKVQHENGKREHAERLNRLRREGLIGTQEAFAAGFLYSQGIIPRDEDVARIGSALDAAFNYRRFLLSTAPEYDFSRHGSDWVDQQLLYYLADPDMYILTNDSQLKARCSASYQSSRIIVI
jgi:hypothetical protein